jgi:hypothetical protein
MFLFGLAGALSVGSTQVPDKLDEVDFRVRTVALGSTYSKVLRNFGKPISVSRQKITDETCGPAHTLLRLAYHGLRIELVGDLRGRDFKVVSMEVRSPKLFVTPGVRIGMGEKAVRGKLGRPWRETNEDGFRILDYVTKGNEGGARLYLSEGRLAKILWEYTAC